MNVGTLRAVVLGWWVSLMRLAVPGLAFAGHASFRDRVCDLRSSWLGSFGGATLIASYHGSFRRGSVALEFIDFDPVALGLPESTVSGARGAWKRTGRRSFDYTFVSYGVGEDREIVYILKLSGPKTISKDCQLFEAVGFLEIFAPGQDPFGDEPPAISGGAIPVGVATAKRMRVDRADP